MKRPGKMESIFPDTLHYYFEKVWESIGESDMNEFGRLHIELIIKVVDTFKAALEKADLLESRWGLQHAFKELEYPMQELHTYFQNSVGSRLNSKDASIFTFFLNEHVKELKEMAIEVDSEL